jgi:hypothetical protein
MPDVMIALGLLLSGLVIMGTRRVPRFEWSDPVNVVCLSLALAGALLLAVRVPRSDEITRGLAGRRLAGLAAWPRFLIGLWLMLSAFIDTWRYIQFVVDLPYMAHTASHLWAWIGLKVALPGDSVLAACYATVGLVSCVAAMVTAARQGKSWELMTAILVLAAAGAMLTPELQ